MGKRILFIDDEPDFTEMTGTLLSFHDFEVDTFNESTKVEEAIRKKQYDLVVTDLMMPAVDGFQLVSMLRKRKEYQKIPIIALSAKTLLDEERKFLLQNKVHFLTKPFEPQGLVEKIRDFLADNG